MTMDRSAMTEGRTDMTGCTIVTATITITTIIAAADAATIKRQQNV